MPITNAMKIRPIGIIHSPFKAKGKTPIQPFKSKKTGRVEVYNKFAAGLQDMLGFSHIILIYRFLDSRYRGLFSTRYPARPNQIGISVVQLLRQKNNVLFVKGIDVLDGTPLLDIKPYVPDFDAVKKTRIGWLKGRL
jgi:tRNA (Thr-GGU) A37 N-methylase